MKLTREKENAPQKALLYCRVSSERQRQDGHGLDSQEHRCRQYAATRGYAVEAVFPDDVSGGGDFMKRPGMVALLAYLDAQPHEKYVVIFDDLKRFARDTEFHFKLRREMDARGATRECLNFKFEDTPEGTFFETIVAAQGQLEREQNSRQVRQKMRANVENGYYIFGPVRGYSYIKREGGGKILAPDPKTAPIVKEGLEGYASGRFQTAPELKTFFDRHAAMLSPRSGNSVPLQSVYNMLRNPLYAGRITIPKYGLHLHTGKHEPLVDFDTWRKIQDRLDGKAISPARKDFREDFILRGSLECADCGHPITAAWPKGRSGLYPYYFCFHKPCPSYRKSIRREKIEGEFEGLLQELQPTRDLFRIVFDMFSDLWNARLKATQDNTTSLKAELARLEHKTSQLVERVLNTDSPALVTAYEAEIKKLEMRKIAVAEKSAIQSENLHTFEESFRTACAFLASPWKLWVSTLQDRRRLVLRLVFADRLSYCRKEGFRTAGIAEPFRVLGALAGDESRMVEGDGFEPSYAEAARFTVWWI